MDKTKVPLIILLILLLISGAIALKFYSDVQRLRQENESLRREKEKLLEEKELLERKYNKLKKQSEEMERKWGVIQDELMEIQRAKNEIERKYKIIMREKERLEEQLEKVRERSRIDKSSVESSSVENKEEKLRERKKVVSYSRSASSGESSDYWADVVKRKAELETKVEELESELRETRLKIAELEKENKDFEMKIEEIIKKKEELERKIRFKERAMDIISRELVYEKEGKKDIYEELSKLKDENMKLREQLKLVNEKKIELESRLKEAIDKRDEFNKKLTCLENALRQRALSFKKLEEELSKIVRGEIPAVVSKVSVPQKEQTSAKRSTSVELPPIVVSPQGSSKEGLQKHVSMTRKQLEGEILAVNTKDNFVIIDLGKANGVEKGDKFEVIRDNKVIGMVEVVETREEISAADITRVLSPFRDGDKVILK